MTPRPSSRRTRGTRGALAFAGAIALAALGASTSPAVAGGHAPASAYVDPPHLSQPWYDALHLKEDHAITAGQGAVVAVVDGDIDPGVPDLRGAHVELKTDCQGNPVRPIRDQRAYHGTGMVTAIVGQGTGNGPGGRGVLGVAPQATVRFYSVDTNPKDPFLECDGTQTGDLILKAVHDGAKIVSISLGGFGLAIEDAVKKANQLGAVVVAASGQKTADSAGEVGGTLDYPAAVPGVVAVNAISSQGAAWKLNPDSFDNPQDKANEPAMATIGAPGVATEIGGYTGSQWRSGQQATGTSPAAAIVAGILALQESRWPSATGNQLIQTLVHHPGDAPAAGQMKWTKLFAWGNASATQMLPVDPTKYPDENPLLLLPRDAEAKYPPSIYGQATTTSTSPSASASPASKGSSTPRNASSPTRATGLPGWVLPVGVVVVLLLAAAAVALRRRGRTTPGPSSQSMPPEPVTSGSTTTHEGN